MFRVRARDVEQWVCRCEFLILVGMCECECVRTSAAVRVARYGCVELQLCSNAFWKQMRNFVCE